MGNAVEDWIAEQNETQRSLLCQLDALIRDLVPGVRTAIRWHRPCYSLTSQFCYLYAAKGHVTLGFDRGTELPDPSGLLAGDGKNMRHVKLGVETDLLEAEIAALIDVAATLARRRAGA